MTRSAQTREGLFWVDGFLSPAQCARMLDELRFAYWTPSTVVRRSARGDTRIAQSLGRVSETTTEEWFSDALQRMVRRLEVRVSSLIGRPASRFEEWQATRYGRGEQFNYHLDSGYWRAEAAGDREKTILIYLDTPARGGATSFREPGIEVQARAGRLLVWDNLLPDGAPNPEMLHAGLPVLRGRKTILVTWVRQRALRIGRQRRREGP